MKIPPLWRIKDPLKLIKLGQLELPGFGLVSAKTAAKLWAELESDSSKRVKKN